MADPVRYSYFTLTCAFTPMAHMRVVRKFLFAVNDGLLFTALSTRARGATVPEWRTAQIDFATQSAQRFCRERYMLAEGVRVEVSDLARIPERGSISVGASPPHYIDGGILWLLTEKTDKGNNPGDSAHGLPMESGF